MKKIKYIAIVDGKRIGEFSNYEDAYKALLNSENHYTNNTSYQIQASLFGGGVKKKGYIKEVEIKGELEL